MAGPDKLIFYPRSLDKQAPKKATAAKCDNCSTVVVCRAVLGLLLAGLLSFLLVWIVCSRSHGDGGAAIELRQRLNRTEALLEEVERYASRLGRDVELERKARARELNGT